MGEVTAATIRNLAGQLQIALQYYSSGSLANYSSYVNINVNTWYRIEYKYDINSSEWEFRVYDDSESLVGSDSGALSATTRIPYYIIGGIYNSTGTTSSVIYSDLLAWSTTSWVGDEREDSRRSSFAVLPYTIFPVPDSTIDKKDRGQASYLYSGLLRDARH